MNICEIIKSDVANGIGIRLSVFVSGCTNHCEGCFQPQTWDFNYGTAFTPEVENDIIAELAKPQYDGITILGGEPFEFINQESIKPLIARIRRELPEKTIWIYTGCIYERDLLPGKRRYSSDTDYILNNIDILVDGPFELNNKDIRLTFKGSSNQRVIDMIQTRAKGYVVLSEYNDKHR